VSSVVEWRDGPAGKASAIAFHRLRVALGQSNHIALEEVAIRPGCAPQYRADSRYCGEGGNAGQDPAEGPADGEDPAAFAPVVSIRAIAPVLLSKDAGAKRNPGSGMTLLVPRQLNHPLAIGSMTQRRHLRIAPRPLSLCLCRCIRNSSRIRTDLRENSVWCRCRRASGAASCRGGCRDRPDRGAAVGQRRIGPALGCRSECVVALYARQRLTGSARRLGALWAATRARAA
jgi:hypothetical protein